MDLPLHSCRPRLLSECGSQGSQLFCRRRRFDLLARGLFPLRDIKFVRVSHSVRGSRKFSIRIPFENWQSHRGYLRAPGRSKFGIVHFEQSDRNRSDESTNFEDGERPPFDLDLAVVLAGFAFEAYNTPAVHFLSSDSKSCKNYKALVQFLR